MVIKQIDVTGSRIIGAITGLGHVGPKHHGIVLGQDQASGAVVVAESMHTGYQLATYEDFCSRYSQNGQIQIKPNEGELPDLTVAQRALDEIVAGGKGVYNLVANNCESFANRAMLGKSTSQQIINTVLGVAVIAGTIWIIKNAKKMA